MEMKAGIFVGVGWVVPQLELRSNPSIGDWHVVESLVTMPKPILGNPCGRAKVLWSGIANGLKCCLNKFATIPDFMCMGDMWRRF